MDQVGTKAPQALVGIGGDMAERVRTHDWAATPLGSPEAWPAELKSAVALMLESRFPKAIVWGPGRVTLYNDAFRPILGDKPEALGRSFAEVWAEAWSEIGPICERAYAGEATFVEDFPLRVDRHGRLEQAWFTFCYSPIRLADGTVAGMIDTVVETTAAVRARTDLHLLNYELGHRLKNSLALVQALASQTFRDVPDRSPVQAFMARLGAMARAHDVLLSQNWAAASLRQVVEETLAPLDGLGQVRVEGFDLSIGSRATMALSLILHELATNAAKHGALSTPDGRVALSWITEAESLKLRWREAGGPPVRQPDHVGFGSRLIDMGLGAGGAVVRRYPPGGFEADIDAPVRALTE